MFTQVQLALDARNCLEVASQCCRRPIFVQNYNEAVEHPDKGLSYYLLPNKKRTKARHFWIFRSATLFGLASFMGCKVGKSGK